MKTMIGEKTTATEFGKALRKLRIDIGISMQTMAKKIEISTAFLSAIELGRKKISNKLLTKIINEYKLDETTINNLKDTACRSNKEIKISLKSYNEKDQEDILVFARNFTSLSDEKKAKIRKLLSEE